MFKPVDNQVSLPKLEEEVLKFWQENSSFAKSLKQRENCEEYVFYDGPPFATGMPHYGHLLAGTIKDVVPRYQTMRGKFVKRTFGWDCHGLPVENEMEKILALNNKKAIEEYGIDKFNEACRGIVLRYTSEWERVVNRMGRWVDFRNGYRTMDRDYMESIWWVFKSLWDKGLIYEGYKILPYCPRCATPLSNFEANQGYMEVVDPAITIRFKSLEEENTYFVAWTTTPWTLPSNLALAVGPEIDYVKIKDGEEFYIMAEARLSAYYKNDMPEIIERYKGSDLAGKTYEPLFNYFADLRSKGAFQVLAAAYVSTEDGSGIVHIAPGFGEDDAAVCHAAGLPEVCPIDDQCCFTAEVPDYQGRYVKEVDNEVIARLKAEGKLIHRGTIKHNYPHCWRDDHPLIYRAISTWFVKIDEIKAAMIASNKDITWFPEHIKEGRFGKWLENARDWAISRNRYWGTPLPVWRNEEGEVICVGSAAELEKLTGQKVDDLHKHFIDKLEIPSPTGKSPLKRIPEVLDCWFESGSMPYAQQHYPFENKEYFESHFPANFISEGLDQTRGWFYTLTILASHLFDKPAFQNCVVNGLVLASDGRKMSKSLRNYTDPVEVINKFGSDALRLFLIHSPVVKADDLRYSDDGVRDVIKNIILPLWNSYSFYVTYANIDEIQPTGHLFDDKLPSNPLDAWLLSITQRLVKDVTNGLDDYDFSGAVDPIVSFIDELNNWYIRRSRRRFWKSENDSDKKEAYEALYIALKTFSQVAAPFVPFITEEMWQNLKNVSDKESVHLTDYPVYNEKWHNEELEFKMATVQKAVSMGRSLRNTFNLKNRQPLASVALVTRDANEKRVLAEMEDSIREELNVKKVEFHDREDELVEYSCKANFKVLGKELGPKMKAAAAVIQTLASEQIQSILEGTSLTIDVDGTSVELTAEKVIVDRSEKDGLKVLNDGTLTVGLDSKITDELKKEGYVRDLVRGIQNLRKESGLNVTDRINLTVGGDDELKAAFAMFESFVSGEVLAASVKFDSNVQNATAVESEDKKWSISIEKA